MAIDLSLLSITRSSFMERRTRCVAKMPLDSEGSGQQTERAVDGGLRGSRVVCETPVSAGSWCSTLMVRFGLIPAGAGRTWFRTCSAVARNVRPRVETFTQPAASRKYRSVEVLVPIKIT